MASARFLGLPEIGGARYASAIDLSDGHAGLIGMIMQIA